MSFNKITLVGNLGRDPELRYTPQGTPVCSFSLATNEKRRDRTTGETQDLTTWFRVTVWGKQAETCSQYLTKGRPVYVEGRLRLEEYVDKEQKTRSALEVNATDVQFLGSRNSSEEQFNKTAADESGGRSAAAAKAGGGGRLSASNMAGHEDQILEDDIPF
jgi:single-strand DNA-binding protein